MSIVIKPFEPSELERIVALSLRAWEPVFGSIRSAMDPNVFDSLYPDWRRSQSEAVSAACLASDHETWVASDDGVPVGFVDLVVHESAGLGEIHMVAVDPSRQDEGIGSALVDFASSRLRKLGAGVVMVETGGDPGHEPARHVYERSGFRVLPIARYFKKL